CPNPRIRAKATSRMRSPTIYAAAAPMSGSCAPCCARLAKGRRVAMLDMTASRRDVLMGSAGLLVSFAFGRPAIGASPPAGAKAGPWKPVPIDNVDSFLAIGHDGIVTVYSGKVDLGTGVRTALTQIV